MPGTLEELSASEPEQILARERFQSLLEELGPAVDDFELALDELFAAVEKKDGAAYALALQDILSATASTAPELQNLLSIPSGELVNQVTGGIFSDGFETGDISAWSNALPFEASLAKRRLWRPVVDAPSERVSRGDGRKLSEVTPTNFLTPKVRANLGVP